MGTVTIVNGTNSLVNASLSAAVNYDWRNMIGPKEYVVLDGGVGLVTLHATYWAGAETEYTDSAATIGMFVAGTIVAVLGVGLAVVTFGGSLALAGVAEATLASMAFGFGMASAAGVMGGVATTIGAIAIAMVDFSKTATSQPGIYAPDNRKFIVKGRLTGTVKNNVFTIEGADDLQLVELKGSEFQNLVLKEGYVEKRTDPAETKPVVMLGVSLDELKKSGMVDTPTWIYPSFSGVPDVKPAQWEFLHDKTKPGTPAQLWNREGPKILWEIQSAGKSTTVSPNKLNELAAVSPGKTKVRISRDTFALFNRGVGGYATVTGDARGALVLSEKITDEARFFMVKSLNCFSFVPVRRPMKVLVTENGHTGDGTKMVIADRVGPHPGWAALGRRPGPPGRPENHTGLTPQGQRPRRACPDLSGGRPAPPAAEGCETVLLGGRSRQDERRRPDPDLGPGRAEGQLADPVQGKAGR